MSDESHEFMPQTGCNVCVCGALEDDPFHLVEAFVPCERCGGYGTTRDAFGQQTEDDCRTCGGSGSVAIGEVDG